MHHHAVIEFNTQGIQLGVQYSGSPIVHSDGAPPPPDDPHRYQPTATPGCRSPHLWLDETRSIFDEFGPDFTLLRLNRDAETRGIAEAARAAGVPLRVVQIDNEEARDLYAANLVLIRPDQHVAWRSDRPPADPTARLRSAAGG